MSVTSDTAAFRIPQTWFWTVACFTAMAAMMADANLDLLDQPWRSLLKVMVLVFAAGTLVSGHRQAEAEGPPSRALDIYNLRVMVTVGACIFTFAVGANVYRRVPLGTPELWLLGLVMSIPVVALIWATVRYLADEADEYLLHLTKMSALIGLAVVLAVVTVWGSLESLGLVPHFWTWWLLPMFGLTNGAGRAWLKARGR